VLPYPDLMGEEWAQKESGCNRIRIWGNNGRRARRRRMKGKGIDIQYIHSCGPPSA